MDAGRRFDFGGGDCGFLPCGFGAMFRNRRTTRSIRRAISSFGNSSGGWLIMSRSIMPIFNSCQEEGRVVGRLLAGYGELEFRLFGCLASAMDDDNTACRVLFRTRGEERKIIVADAFMREKYENIGLLNPYSEAIADLQWCRQLRNQFAHCIWYMPAHRLTLSIVDLEDAAQTKTGDLKTYRKYIDINLLLEQEKYFIYVNDCLLHLEAEYSLRAGKTASHASLLPKKIERPPKHNDSPLQWNLTHSVSSAAISRSESSGNL